MNKLSAVWNLFRVGEQVANPGVWKQAANFGAILGAFVLGAFNVAKAFGYGQSIDITPEQANTVGLGVATAVAWVLNNITSRKAGVLPAKPAGTLKPIEPFQSVTQGDPPVRASVPTVATVDASVDTRVPSIDAATRARAEQQVNSIGFSD